MRLLESTIAIFCAATLSACVYVNDASSDVAERYTDAGPKGSSYKSLRPDDPVFQTVSGIATSAAYEAQPTRALVESVSVLQAASGDYIAHVTMSGGDLGAKYRLVVVEQASDGGLVSKGVILH